MPKTKRDSGRNRQKQKMVLPPSPEAKGPLPRKDRTRPESLGTKVSIRK